MFRMLLVLALIVPVSACAFAAEIPSTDAQLPPVSLAPAPQRPAAEGLTLDQLLEKMDAKAREMKTLEADVSIVNTENFSGRQSVRSGKIYVKKPDSLHLDLLQPYPRKIWISADSIVDYRADLKTGDRVKLAQGSEKPKVIGISTTSAELKESFDLSLAPPGERPKEYTLTLVPREGVKTDFTSAEVTLDAATLLPVSIVQKNADLDETKTFAFSDTRVNPRLADSLFEPTLPADADLEEHEGDWKGP